MKNPENKKSRKSKIRESTCLSGNRSEGGIKPLRALKRKEGISASQQARVFYKNPDMVTRVIDGETILLPTYKTSDEINCIYTLNKVASRVWELINGKRTSGEITRRVLKEFDTTPHEAGEEMKKFLKELKETRAIR